MQDPWHISLGSSMGPCRTLGTFFLGCLHLKDYCHSKPFETGLNTLNALNDRPIWDHFERPIWVVLVSLIHIGWQICTYFSKYGWEFPILLLYTAWNYGNLHQNHSNRSEPFSTLSTSPPTYRCCELTQYHCHYLVVYIFMGPLCISGIFLIHELM